MIAVVDYDAGNLTSVGRALAHLGQKYVITRNHDEIMGADRVVFPGVGAAASAMESLRRYGLADVLKRVLASGRPLLGICLGTQIITGYSEEGSVPCLDLIPGRVRAFPLAMTEDGGRPLKIPHMGWNTVVVRKPHPVLQDMEEGDAFYFVHGYYPEPENREHILATTAYGIDFVSAMGFENLVATQFHPEKSGEPGLRLLDHFCRWEGRP
ncbi:imidazole glycerol phosphate synthase subunit HisH [Desulfobotulus sp. H1]|uniref:Imidazole glycerol phosphate synthase subunit HisH n=1 Tax=Desulfobotulus pelophilus TaxID=2823377 RepID=A0ABT3N4W8_9BACT|nr:imidazole glycerol phosphate synthase subunit HisH [Desulfobotulus pelophilus]MCW7752489.1 imidazole glycerol phosphate synthase subunit HisH [Desulfobotulus pelophilus]